MGLLFQFPTEDSEQDDRIEQSKDQLTLKTYGLPMIFWGYFSAVVITILIMYLAIKNPIKTVFSGDDLINQYLASGVIGLLIFIPVFCLGILFYEKHIIATSGKLQIKHRLFWITLFSKKITLNKNEPIVLEHFEGTPNIAKIENKQELQGFQNRGYFNLYAHNQNNQFILIDRHSQKHTLKKMQSLLLGYTKSSEDVLKP